ncbi:MAG: TlpA family protein disulfide reductase [Sphingomonas sp.]|uniref:TlpA family protein disulfide reductase n=1 Tax=Sphingomonas sp. TaxID=28214 RepID=UPI003F803B1B
MRSIVLLLAATALIGGCDRPSVPKGQANETAALPTLDEAANMAPAPSSSPDTGVDVIGKLVRDHKGDAAPKAGFTGPDGKPLTLASFAGKPVLLNLWATWCGPCKAEMPTLDKVAGEGKLQVVTISQDLDGKAAVDPYLAKAGLKSVKGYTDKELNMSQAFGNPSLPTTILYDSSGKEVWRMLGGMDWASPTARALLAEAK